MSSIKISQLPQLPSIAANTSNTLFLGVDVPTGITGKFTATTLAEQLYANNALTVGNNIILFSNTVGQLSGYDPTFLQVNMQNFNANGSGDFVITGDKGTNSNNFIDLGLSGSSFETNFTVGSAFLPNDGYLFVQGPDGPGEGNLLIGTAAANTTTWFVSGGLNTENIVGHIDADGIHSISIDREIAANLVTGLAYTNTKISAVNSDIANNVVKTQAAFNQANTANVGVLNLVGQVNILQSQLSSNANNIAGLTTYAQSAYATINTISISSNTANLAVFTQAAFNTANGASNAITSLIVINGVQNNAINAVNSIATSALANTSEAIFGGNLNIAGKLQVNNSTFAANSQAVSINGAANGARQTPAADGYMLHITGKDGIPSKVVVDAFGTGAYPLFTGRQGRGTAGAPLATANGDVIARYSSSSYSSGNTGFLPLGVGRIDFMATEDHTDTNRGTQITFFTINNGSNTLTQTAQFNGNTAIFPNNVQANNIILTGSLTANALAGQVFFSNISIGSSQANTVQFYPSVTPPTQGAGQLWYKPDVQTLVLDTDIAGDRPGLGRVIYERVYNNTGATIGANTVVRLQGSVTGNAIPYISLASANTALESDVLGIVKNAIANGAYGYSYSAGIVEDINTSAFANGAIVFLSSTPGQMTTVAPVSSSLATIQLGKILSGGTTTGKMQVDILPRPEYGKANGAILFANNSITVASNTIIINEAAGTLSVANGVLRTTRTLSGAQTAFGFDFTGDTIVRATCAAACAITPANFLAGKEVTVILTNTAGGPGKVITHGVSALNSTVGATTFTLSGTTTAFLRYMSFDGDIANTYVSVTFS